MPVCTAIASRSCSRSTVVKVTVGSSVRVSVAPLCSGMMNGGGGGDSSDVLSTDGGDGGDANVPTAEEPAQQIGQLAISCCVCVAVYE